MATKVSDVTPKRYGNLTGPARILNDLVVTFHNQVQSWKGFVVDAVHALQQIQLFFDDTAKLEKFSNTVGVAISNMKEKVSEMKRCVYKLEHLALLNTSQPSGCRTWPYSRIVDEVRNITKAYSSETRFREKLVSSMEARSADDIEIIVVMWLHANVVDTWAEAIMETLLMECHLKY